MNDNHLCFWPFLASSLVLTLNPRRHFQFWSSLIAFREYEYSMIIVWSFCCPFHRSPDLNYRLMIMVTNWEFAWGWPGIKVQVVCKAFLFFLYLASWMNSKILSINTLDFNYGFSRLGVKKLAVSSHSRFPLLFHCILFNLHDHFILNPRQSIKIIIIILNASLSQLMICGCDATDEAVAPV